jgi:CRISPR system Cascade subunit CasE
VTFNKTDNTHRIVLTTATYDGMLRIANPDLARYHLLNGVGAAKGYGCGLITLAPPAPSDSERA